MMIVAKGELAQFYMAQLLVSRGCSATARSHLSIREVATDA